VIGSGDGSLVWIDRGVAVSAALSTGELHELIMNQTADRAA
jgi:hypothetical protein